MLWSWPRQHMWSSSERRISVCLFLRCRFSWAEFLAQAWSSMLEMMSWLVSTTSPTTRLSSSSRSTITGRGGRGRAANIMARISWVESKGLDSVRNSPSMLSGAGTIPGTDQSVP